MHEHKQNQCKRKVKLFTKKLALTYCNHYSEFDKFHQALNR